MDVAAAAEASALGRRVGAYFRAQGTRYGLRPARTRVRTVLNWGGFVNRSFTVTDGVLAYHLKLTDEEGHAAALERWAALRQVLTARYRAPELVDWIAVPGTAFRGPLFRRLAGAPPDLERTPALLPDVLALAGRLHADGELQADLRRVEAPAPAGLADAFCETFVDRFRGDLDGVAAARPPFVSPELLAWMREETRRLAERVRASPAFAGPAEAPVHGDLHAGNLLVAPSGEWFVLDWDDLGLGDPVLDAAVLLWPRLRAAPDAWRAYPVPGRGAPALAARMALHLRALLLDEVVDSLADWVEAAAVPEHLEAVRPVKRRAHERALGFYRERYGA